MSAHFSLLRGSELDNQVVDPQEDFSEGAVPAQMLIDNFELLVGAMRGVEQIRRLIVELALRGYLIRADLDVTRPIRAPMANTGSAALPALPQGWAWVPLRSITKDGPKNGYSPKGVEYETPVKSLTLTATTSGRFNPECFKYIDEQIPRDSEYWLRDGDVLVQRGNTIEYVGVAAVYRGPPWTFIYPDLMMRIRVADDVDVNFVHMALNGLIARDFMRSRASGTSGTMPKINQATLLETPVPLPPPTEQERIVARVDKLMTVIDELEAKQARKADIGARFAKASLEALTSAAGPEEFNAAWKRVVDNFDILVPSSTSISSLRDAIIEIAVSEWTARAGADWGTVNDVVVDMDAGWSPKCDEASRTSDSQWAVLRTTSVQRSAFQPQHHKVLPKSLAPRPQLQIERGNVLVTRAGPTVRVGVACAVIVAPPRLMLSDKIIRLRIRADIDPAFLALVLNAGRSQQHLKAAQSGMDLAQVNISQARLRATPIPIATLSVQKQIVTTLDQLMSRCDELEAKLRRTEDRASKLVEAVVQGMVG